MTSADVVSPSWAAYVPRVAREWVDSADASVTKHRRVAGSMLFADVSGFTKMSERLARHGRIGAESVTEIISSCFNRLLEEAYAYGATLLQFGGDAVLLLFRDDGHERRAAAAALGMRRVLRSMRGFPTEAGRVTLNMTVGVESGAFDLFLVGESHRQLVVGGPRASHLVELEASATTGRIVVGAELAAALPPANVGPPAGEGRALRGTVEADRHDGVEFLVVGADMSSYVPVGLVRAIEAGSVDSEHRTASIGFVQYRGLDTVLADHGPEEAAARLDALVVGVQQAIDDRGICFQSADVGRDGGKFYLSVGAPLSTGHDEEQMLLALREIVELDVGLDVRAGANSGPVYTGELGTTHRRTFTTMGDTVNLAARVMGKAEWGRLLATEAVLDRSRTLFETERVPPLRVKGKRHAVPALVVGPARGSRVAIASSDVPLIGRDEELRRLHEAAASAGAGRGRLVELIAEPGSGKSRLLDQFEAEVSGVEVHRVGCRLYQASTPYYAVVELLRGVLGLSAELDGVEAVERLDAAVSTIAPELAPWRALLAAPFGLQLEPSPEILALDPELRGQRLEESIVRLLERAITEPSVICIEDAHWMDDASAAVFDALVEGVAGRPWLLLLAGRDTGSGLLPGEGGPDDRIRLAPLGPDAIAGLVAAATRADPLAPHAVATIVERCDGNPLFALELVNAVQAGGSVEALPSSIDGLITARIDRLDPDDRTVLRHVSTLGAGFRTEYVDTVLDGTSSTSARPALQRLADFVSIDETGWVEFRHHLVRDVAYEGLPYRTRRRLHALIAESVLERVGARPEDEAPLLSLHFAAAHRHPEAWRYSGLAGDRSRDVYANVEAAVYYERALTAARHLDDVSDAERARTFESLGDVQDLAGLYDEARSSFTAARGLLDDPIEHARLDLKTAFVDERLGRLTAAVRRILRARRRLDGLAGTRADEQRARLAAWCAAVRIAQGRFDDALAESDEAIRTARAVDDRASLARAYLTRDVARSVLGMDVDMSDTRRALDISTDLGDLRGQASAANSLGAYAFLAGRWDEAETLYRRSRAARELAGDPVNAAGADANLAEILVEQGRYDEAESVLAEVASIMAAAGDRATGAFADRLRGVNSARRGDLDASAEQLLGAREALEEVGAPGDLVETDVAVAEQRLRAGRAGEALDLLDGLIATDLASLGADHLAAPIQRLRGLARWVIDGSDRGDLEASLELAREIGADHEIARTIEAMATVAETTGEPPSAELEEERRVISARLGLIPRPALAQRK